MGQIAVDQPECVQRLISCEHVNEKVDARIVDQSIVMKIELLQVRC